jgi:hypothetical protein
VAYVVEGVKFDGFKNGVLLETKGPGYVKFVEPPNTFKDWFARRGEILLQATHQVRVARGAPIEWHVADLELKAALDRMFHEEGIAGIRVLHTRVR